MAASCCGLFSAKAPQAQEVSNIYLKGYPFTITSLSEGIPWRCQDRKVSQNMFLLSRVEAVRELELHYGQVLKERCKLIRIVGTSQFEVL